MSGGHFNYVDCSLRDEIFGWDDQIKNPLEDYEISNIVKDIFDLLHDFDWYQSGDTNEDDYKESVKAFKKKWFKNIEATRKDIIDTTINDVKKELYDSFCWSEYEQK